MAFNRKARLQANIDAIRTAFALRDEVRVPTDAERETISQYCGFGGLKCVLNPVENKAVWSKSDLPLYDLTAELHRIIREKSEDETDYKRYVASMKQSVLTAFYTPKEIPEAIWSVFGEMNLRPQKVLEPSAGMGVFIDAMRTVNPNAKVTAFEKDKLTGLLLSELHANEGMDIHVEGFEHIQPSEMGKFDLAISNIPFGDTKVYDPVYSDSKSLFHRVISKSIHGYFMQKGLDSVRDGGMVAFITTRNYLDREQNSIRINHLFQQADLVTAFRLPDNLFKESANTEAGSDLIIIQKNLGKQGLTEDEERLKRVYSAEDENIVRNDYFEHHPENVLATSILRGHDQYGKPALEYLHTGGVEGIANDLRERLQDELPQHLDFRKFTGLDSPAFIRKEQEEQPAPVEEKQKPETAKIVTMTEPVESVRLEEKTMPTHTPDNNPQLSLFDLWGMTVQEQPKPEPKKPKKERKKERLAREQQERKAEMQKKSHIEQQMAVYDSLDWEENPPINGFYEMMMDLTPERRRQLLEAGQQRIETNVDAKAQQQGLGQGKSEEQTEPKQPRTTKTKVVQPKPFEGELRSYYRNGSIVEDKDGNIGHLEGITRSGATFVPLIVSQEQTDRIRQ
ncbi:MAG: N-6 DNA methylase, partial [Prevotella sp.]|nr:N-6 DNA methylase [Prevotella sp.]